MNTSRIIQAANDIAEHETALKWLREFGPKLTGKDGASVNITLNFAGSCVGAKEAARMLEAYAALDLPNLVSTAIRSCENTIELCRSVIADEATRP